MSTAMEGKAILVTGANRGIGQALVTEALRRGQRECTPERGSHTPTRTRGSPL
jgi:NAD(P)-dependent dehydrogenase (short-subunit alcohol dehydrogenase family)